MNKKIKGMSKYVNKKKEGGDVEKEEGWIEKGNFFLLITFMDGWAIYTINTLNITIDLTSD